MKTKPESQRQAAPVAACIFDIKNTSPCRRGSRDYDYAVFPVPLRSRTKAGPAGSGPDALVAAGYCMPYKT